MEDWVIVAVLLGIVGAFFFGLGVVKWLWKCHDKHEREKKQ